MLIRLQHAPAFFLDVVFAERMVDLHLAAFPLCKGFLDCPAAMHRGPWEHALADACARSRPALLPCEKQAPQLVFSRSLLELFQVLRLLLALGVLLEAIPILLAFLAKPPLRRHPRCHLAYPTHDCCLVAHPNLSRIFATTVARTHGAQGQDTSTATAAATTTATTDAGDHALLRIRQRSFWFTTIKPFTHPLAEGH